MTQKTIFEVVGEREGATVGQSDAQSRSDADDAGRLLHIASKEGRNEGREHGGNGGSGNVRFGPLENCTSP